MKKNKKIWLGMLVIALVFGMTVVGCEPEDDDNGGGGGGGGGGGTPPSTGNVSLSLSTSSNYLPSSSTYTYRIDISLDLSEGTWTSAPTANTAKSWVTVSGITLTTWDFQVSRNGQSLDLLYWILGSPSISISSGINVSIDTTKLNEMKGYTNITDNLTIGSPATRTSSAWTSY